MKYLSSFFFFIITSLYLYADNSVLKKAELRVLDIGNSYSVDATTLLPLIAKASHSDLSTMCLYRCSRGGASFKNWVDVYNDQDETRNYTIKKVLGDLPANVKTGTGEAGDGKLFRDVLTDEKWDLIIIHQVSTYAPYYSMWKSYNSAGYLDELISVIKKHQPDAELGFLLVHSSWGGYYRNAENSSFDRWQLIANSTKSFCEDYDVDFVIPYGTAIQNLRASSLNNEYDLTRDGTHCGYGLTQYTAACCYYESLIAPRSGISVLGNSARIDVSDERSDYPGVNVTDDNALIAQRAAYLATKDMYHCQDPELNPDVNGDGKVNVADIVMMVNKGGAANNVDIMTIVNTIYNLQGNRIGNFQRGMNIVRMNDGKMKKIIVKEYHRSKPYGICCNRGMGETGV